MHEGTLDILNHFRSNQDFVLFSNLSYWHLVQFYIVERVSEIQCIF